MNTIWHKYPERKPRHDGLYVVIDACDRICTTKWKSDEGKFVLDDLIVDPITKELTLKTCVKYWAYLDDFIIDEADECVSKCKHENDVGSEEVKEND